MAWLIAALIVTAVLCALAVLVLLAAMRVDAIRRTQDEGFPEAFGDWPNVPERFAPPTKIAEGGKDG